MQFIRGYVSEVTQRPHEVSPQADPFIRVIQPVRAWRELLSEVVTNNSSV